tara:strand:- start:20 stop:1156 length:1137 start_codon:yes stop_codon:yes gene_type:complete
MANQNIRIPRFYPCLINFLLSRGIAQDGNFDVTATGGSGATATVGLASGTEAELFDMKPLNKVFFNTTSDVDARVLITLDTQDASGDKDYIAILNHNLNTAKGKIRIFAGNIASDVATVNGGACETADIDWSDQTVSEVVNADTRNADGGRLSYVIEPAKDGTTIFTIRKTDDDSSSSLRYWAIQFEGADGDSGADEPDGDFDASTNLHVAGIMIGEYYDMPHAPDLAVKRSITYDNKIQESLGGQRFSNMVSHGRQATSTTLSPFVEHLEVGVDVGKNYRVYGGRLNYDMKFSYLSSANVMPSEYDSTRIAGDTVLDDIWNKTSGSHIPFIFSIDSLSQGDDAESEHIFARFDQNKLDMTQVASDTWNIRMKISEEF